jgi:hypothetical protein
LQEPATSKVIPLNDDEFKSVLAKLKPVIGQLADAYWLASLMEPERKKDIHAVAQALASELLDEGYSGKHILLEPPPRQKSKGGYPLGTVMYAGKPSGIFGLRESDWPQHVAILGRSGAGKTNIGHIIIWNLLKAEKPFIVLDWRRNYSHFKERPEGKNIMLFPLGEEKSLYFNPLKPPARLSGNQLQAYQRDIVSVILGAYLPGNHLLSTRGVEYFMLRAIEDLERESGEFITFDDMRYYVEDYRAAGFERDWKVTSLNALYKLTTGPIGRLFNSVDGTALADILDKQAILELDSLGSRTDRSAFTQSLLLWLYYYRLTEGKTISFKHAFIVEEAHNLFLKTKNGDQPLNDYVMRQMRDLGQSLVLLDQNPSLISIPALGNTGTTICLNLKHGDDVEAAGKALTLPKEQWENIGKLKTGQAIVKVQDRWPKPFLVKFPLFPVSGSLGPRRRPGETVLTDSLQRTPEDGDSAQKERIRAPPASDRRERKEEEISSEERDFLRDIAEYPLSVVTERYGRLGLSVHKGNAIKENLLETGLIEQEKVSVPQGSVTLLKATEKGRELLASWGIQPKALPHNGSLSHEYTKKRIAEEYRSRGYHVEEEYPLGGGKAVDLMATKGDERIAIEVETGKSQVNENLRKCKEAGFEKVVVVRTNGTPHLKSGN